MIQKLIITLTFIVFYINAYAQGNENVSKPNNKKATKLLISGGIIYTGTMIGLNNLWYKKYPKSSFHSFDDSREWLQMDKMGHLVTSYFVGYVGHESFTNMGFNENKSRYIGGTLGLFFLTGIEVLDGFSTEWGFSWGDQLANFSGAGLFMLQDKVWNEQKIKLKWSYTSSPYAKLNPSLLGSTLSERLLKDYNGQTYWATGNISSLLNLKEESKFPKWLNIAVGHGVDGLIGGHNNDVLETGISFDRTRQYYLSFDIDLSRIESKSEIFNTLKKAIGFIKFPSPTIEFNKNNTNLYWLYF